MAYTRSTPRTAPIPVAAALSFLSVLDHLAEAMRRRLIRRSYGPMSVAQLRDIGLTPHDLEVALSLPLKRNAWAYLADAAAAEAAKW